MQSLYEKSSWISYWLFSFFFTTTSDGMELFTAQIKIWYSVTTIMVLIGRLCFSLLRYPRIMLFLENCCILYAVVVNIKFFRLFQRLFTHLHVTNKWSIVFQLGSNLHILQESLAAMEVLFNNLLTPRIISLYWNQVNLLSWTILKVTWKTLSHACVIINAWFLGSESILFYIWFPLSPQLFYCI